MKLKAIAYHLEERLKVTDIQKKIEYSLIRKEHSYLFYQVDDQSYIYIKDFGSVVFVNCPEEVVKATINSLIDKNVVLSELPFEAFDILIEENKSQNVAFDVIYVKELNADIAQVIMMNLAQSAAIDHYVNDSMKLIDGIKQYSDQLENKGRILLSFKKMRKFIGETMNIKNRIAKNLFIFETSNLAWSKENLSDLDNQLRFQLDVVNRFRGLENNLNIVKENLDFFQAIIQHKHSSVLEWIIIILILFEVIQVIF